MQAESLPKWRNLYNPEQSKCQSIVCMRLSNRFFLKIYKMSRIMKEITIYKIILKKDTLVKIATS